MNCVFLFGRERGIAQGTELLRAKKWIIDIDLSAVSEESLLKKFRAREGNLAYIAPVSYSKNQHRLLG